jgi:hypothetical protein
MLVAAMTGEGFALRVAPPTPQRRKRFSIQVEAAMTSVSTPLFRCRTASEIHDFRAHFGRKKPSQ